jgi:NAD(P)-dependent dehydrogenase (short-subunit alcohol dehydrogenase family)
MPAKVAFVTGAASGIGRATAIAFAAAGYSVALTDRDAPGGRETEAMLGALGHAARFVLCDVADEASVAAAIDGTVSAFGALDAAFNGAGIDGEEGRLTADCTQANWDRVLAIDLTGVWYCMKHQIPAMLENGGAIVNCASVAGLIGAPTYAAYSAAKHGVIGLTKSAALEYAAQGIRINAVCPGMIDTPMTRGDPGKEVMFDTLVATSPTGRRGLPEEIAEAAVWLCSDKASFVIGQGIPVDGGWTSR